MLAIHVLIHVAIAACMECSTALKCDAFVG